ncbi:LytR/AlgR family response regulator transcription factor [Carboxylicivirga sp. N1Y90]|uniref:LytR/AlgR family response regulator transcription factor n=1 Tax=Carboxylicivirga fragile TaxID=3417571 RepID=UPI003D32A047|nr:response regulator transcription factor [Marinilabiliaceae bacterium N1Y90]
MKVRCIIIDDEFPARELLQDFISKFSHLELLGSFKSPLEALPLLQYNQVDLMFLDIQMPDITGIDFLKTLTKKPLVVFTTAYMEYAIEGYELDVLDYLVKPFSFERFMHTINKVADRLPSRNETNAPQAITDTQADSKDYIMVKADHKIYRLKFKDILYIEGLREYVTFYCNNEKLVSLDSLRNLEQTLEQHGFIRVHKSYIVNIEKIAAFYGNQLKLDTVSKYIPIGKSYKEAVNKQLVNS